MAVAQCMLLVVGLLVASGLVRGAPGSEDPWAEVRAVMEAGVAQRVYPGAVAMVSDPKGVLFSHTVGNHTYGLPTPLNPAFPGAPYTSPPTNLTTLFDMASLTKVVATTTATMLLYQRGILDLNAKVTDYLGDEFGVNGKDGIAVKNLLLHDAGFYPDPVPNFWSPEFGCPATMAAHHPLEDFSCQSKILRGVLNQSLMYPTNSAMVYSDLSMITMMYVIGALVEQYSLVPQSSVLQQCLTNQERVSDKVGPQAQCYYEAFVRIEVLEKIGMQSSGFLPAVSTWPDCAPTWNDTDGDSPGPAYRHRLIQGQVSDGNSYALGGIAGHAGLFSTVEDATKLARVLMFPTASDPLLNLSTIKLFTTAYNLSQSSRALGWDTNSYKMNDYRGCGNFSEQTFTHTGYTGTQICNDPTNRIITVLLTNRVYPVADEFSIHKIHIQRQLFNNAVLRAINVNSRSTS